jgi:hypothetical protein
MARPQVGQLDAPAGEYGVAADEDGVGPLAHKSCEGRVDLAAGAGFLLLGGETQFSSIIARSVIGGTHVQTPIDHRQHASVLNLRFTRANTITRRHDGGA